MKSRDEALRDALQEVKRAGIDPVELALAILAEAPPPEGVHGLIGVRTHLERLNELAADHLLHVTRWQGGPALCHHKHKDETSRITAAPALADCLRCLRLTHRPDLGPGTLNELLQHRCCLGCVNAPTQDHWCDCCRGVCVAYLPSPAPPSNAVQGTLEIPGWYQLRGQTIRRPEQ